MRTYGLRTCFYCGRQISTNGLATSGHMRKHVREGILKEVRYRDAAYGKAYGGYFELVNYDRWIECYPDKANSKKE